jgi:pimeloyl-ACP methyl ester carboxylesterase
MIQDKIIQYKNTNIRFRDSGKGTAVVLLHGFLERLEMWNYFESILNKTNRIISIDLLGHGETGSIGYVHTMANMAEYVKAVLDSLKIRKYILVGHSMGGYVALSLAEKFTDNIKGLCLFHSTSLADTEEKKRGREQAIRLVKENHKSFIRKAIPMLFRPKNRKVYSEELKEAKRMALTTSKQGVIAALEGMKIREDFEMVLHFSPFPKQMIIGRYDNALLYESLKGQVEGVENITINEFPIGHMGHIEAKEETLSALRQFIKSIK